MLEPIALFNKELINKPKSREEAFLSKKLND